MKKKRQFHCNACGNPCDIYRKGKNHRVLVCHACGVLATNPGIFKRIAKGALGEIPGASLAMEGLGLAGDLLGKKKKETTPGYQKMVTDSLDKPNKGERYVRMALEG